MTQNRPQLRSQCIKGLRPCPWIGCTHHLFWGTRKIHNISDDQILDTIEGMPETCTLDVAARGGLTEVEVAQVLGLSRQKIWHTLNRASKRLRRSKHLKLLIDFAPESHAKEKKVEQMIWQPKPGQTVQIKYRLSMRKETGIHDSTGTIMKVGSGNKPKNCLVTLSDDRPVVVPRGNLFAI